MNEVWIIGSGTLASLIVETIEDNNMFNIKGIFDDTRIKGTEALGYQIVGKTKDITISNHRNLVIAIGEPTVRKKIFSQYLNLGHSFPNIISDKSLLSKNTRMGIGNFIAPSCTIMGGTVIGNGCCILAGTTINQNNKIENYALIGSCSVTGNSVQIGEGAHLKLASIVELNAQVESWSYNG